MNVNIKVEKQGLLRNAKMSIQDANFSIIEEKVQNQYIKEIDVEKNEIEFNTIIYSNDVQIELPIKFNKGESFAEDYFEKNIKVEFEGEYENETVLNVKAERTLEMNWTAEVEVGLTQDIEKYIDLGNETLVQQNIYTEVVDNILPRRQETLNVKVPDMNGAYPMEVVVLVNGVKLNEENVKYDVENGNLEIVNKKLLNANGYMNWGNAINEYNLIYTYGNKEEFLENRAFNLDTKAEVLLFGSATKIQKEEQTLDETELKGTIVDIDKEVTKELYKGYMYANSNETSFEEINTVKVSKANAIEGIELTTLETMFMDEQGNEYDVSSSTIYKSTAINKNQLERIFGKEYSIEILDSEDNTLAIITENTEGDASGNVIINYENEVTDIKIRTSEIKNEGNFNIKNTRAIKGNGNYSKIKLKTFNKLVIGSNVVEGENYSESQSEILLNDTITDARIVMNNTGLSTISKNENVQILAILKSDSEKYDLYKNPYLEIKLPEEIQEISVNSINLMYEDELRIVDANYNAETKIITLQIEGEQTSFKTKMEEGIQVVISADLTFKKDIPTKETTISMTYRNENGNEERYETSSNIQLNSKYGAILYSNIEGYNEENETIETIENGTVEAQLDSNVEEKQPDIYQAFINNYNNPIEKVVMIGKVSKEDNLETSLASAISTNKENAKIYYSDKENPTVEDESWVENTEGLEQVKSYKLELNEELQPKDAVNVLYKINIPGQLENGEQSNRKTEVTYYYNGQELKDSSTIVLATQERTAKEVLGEGVTIEYLATSANKTIVNEEEISELQPIQYTVKVTNTTAEDLNNLQLTAEYTNAVYYVETEKEAEVTDSEVPEILKITKKDENAKNITKTIGTLASGRSATITYLVAPKKIDGDKITGTIKLNADNLEEKQMSTITNIIKDAKLGIDVENGQDENEPIYENNTIPFKYNITNNSKSKQKDIILQLPASNQLTLITPDKDIINEAGLEIVENDANGIKLKIAKLDENETKEFYLLFRVEEIKNNKLQDKINMYYTANDGDTTYYSNTVERDIYRENAKVTGSQFANVEEKVVRNGDKIIYTAEITNNDTELVAENMNIKQAVTAVNSKISNAYLRTENGGIINADIYSTSGAMAIYSLQPGETIEYVSEVEIWENPDTKLDYKDDATSNIILQWDKMGYLNLNEVTNTYTTQPVGFGVPKKEEGSSSKTSTKESQTTDSSSSAGTSKEKTYAISGVAWMDKNKNGKKDTDEKRLENIDVRLMNAETGDILTETKTNASGYYEFASLKNGKYNVLFDYDDVVYSTTQYKKESVGEDSNSNVVERNVSGTNYAVTDTLVITSKDLRNVNAGFTQNVKFDLNLNKAVTNITVKNKEGTRTVKYNKDKLAKVEVAAKQVNNTTITVEYVFEIKNEGDMQGYVNEIVDYKPTDLEFSQNNNDGWYMGTDGNLHNVSLSNNIIKPGEVKELTLRLTKKLTEDNTGTSINTAEIAVSSNELSVPDEDSVAGNKKDNEDDISTAEVLISVKTGLVMTISITTIIVILIVVAYVIYRKKRGGIQDGNENN